MSERDQFPNVDLDEVEAQLRDLRRRKTVRWTMSRETAEMAIAALRTREDRGRRPRQGSGKSRRRKRGKRLL